MEHVRYDVPGWGVGQLWLAGGTLLEHELPTPDHERRGRGEHRLARRLQAYFRGEAVTFDDVEIDLSWATPFQRALARALRAVQAGELVTYGELAALAGRPNAPRAAGTFCSQNRFPLVVPCHRVVAADGIGGYGSLGFGYKRRLLALEGVEP